MDEVEYTTKLTYLSNVWYNDGLKKAQIRDLSGAVASLKKSLQYNRDNVPARNLLGLVYYGRGEVAEALVEWIISKNMQSHGNIATYYLKKVQEATKELETINQAVKKYNQCLEYCQQNSEDLAMIQLRKVISDHPSFLKAYQLLTLLYMQTEQYAKARQMIRKAHKLDTTNETTLRYMHELQQLRSARNGNGRNGNSRNGKEEKAQTVSYQIGNETIIQPLSSTLRDNAGFLTILNIVIGLVVGAAVVWFLIVPTMRQRMEAKTNQEIIYYSEQLAAKNSEIDLLKRTMETYEQERESLEEEKEHARGTQATYEALVTMIAHYNDKNYDRAKLADELMAIKPESLGSIGKTSYDTIAKEVYAEQCAKLYPTVKRSFAAKNYKATIETIERILKMDGMYDDGKAMLLQMQSYYHEGDKEKAEVIYNQILETFPNTTTAKDATAFMTGQTKKEAAEQATDQTTQETETIQTTQ